MPTEVERTIDLQMDHRGRVIIPKQIRDRYDIEPEEGESAWVTITVHEADVGGDS